MFIIVILFLLLLIFDILAMRWGYNSSDGPEHKEWERKRSWPVSL